MTNAANFPDEHSETNEITPETTDESSVAIEQAENAVESTDEAANEAAEPSADTAPAEQEGEEEPKQRIDQEVVIDDAGPCKKHIKVTVGESSIDDCFQNKLSELMKDTVVPGFRKGKAPRKVFERMYRKEVNQQIKGELLMASMEQLAEEFDIAPLSPPSLNPDKIEVPSSGPMVYEFDVEVRPQFEVPEYKGLKIKRPVRVITEEDVGREQRRILSRYGQLVPKDGAVEEEDYMIVDMVTRVQDKVIGHAKELTLRVDERLAFKDGVAENFAEQVVGARAGDTRTVDITMGDNVASAALAGRTVSAELQIHDVKMLRLPELTDEFLHSFGVHSEEELRDEIRSLLERRLEYQQRQSFRQQILQHFEEASRWELPQDLLLRQARRTMSRRVMEMRDAGMSEEEIQGQMRLMQQDVVRSTAMSLKEHFVLQKVAELEKIEVSDEEINAEIEEMAEESDESPRRVRARLEKENAMETLATLVIERKALDLILANAEYEDVPVDKPDEGGVALSEEQAVEGEMRDVTDVPEEEPEKEESGSEEEAQEAKD